MSKPLYFTAYLREIRDQDAVRRLSLVEFGAFMRILIECWYQHVDCSVANDDVLLANTVGLPLARWKSIRSKVMACFIESGDRYTHPELLKSYEIAVRTMQGRRKGAEITNARKSSIDVAQRPLSARSAPAQRYTSLLSPLVSSPGKGSAEGKPEEAIIATQSDSFATTHATPPLTHSNGTAGHPGGPQGNLKPVPVEDSGQSPLPWTVTSAGIAYDAGEAAYQLYKRKQVAPRNARMAFGRAADRAAEAKKLSPVLALVWMYGRVKAWTESHAYRTTEHQFLKQLDTWLDGDGWDEPEESWARDMRDPVAKPASKVIDAADVSRAIAEAQARHDSIHKPRRRA